MSFEIKAVIEAVDKASGAINKVGNSFKKLADVGEKSTGRLRSAFGKLSDVVKIAGGFIAAELGIRAMDAVRNFVDGSIEKFTEFQKTVTMVVSATGASGEQFKETYDMITKAAEDAALKLGLTATEAAQGLEALVKAGLEGADAVNALSSALMLAKLEGISAEEAASLLVSTLAQFRLSADKAAEAVDALNNASILGIGSAKEYGLGLAYAGSAAHNLGLSLQETLAALVLVDATQKDAAKSGRYLNALFSDLIQKSEKLGFSLYDTQGNMLSLAEIIDALTAKLRSFGTQAERDAYLQAVFGEQGKRAALALIGQSQALEDLTEKMSQTGTTMQIFSQYQETIAGKTDMLNAKMDQLERQLGEVLAPAKLAAMEFIYMVLKGWALIFERLGEAIGPTIIAFGEFVAEGRFVEALSAALQLAITLLVQRFKEMGESIKTAVSAIVSGFNALKSAWDVTVGAISDGIKTLVSAFEKLYSMLVGGSIIPELASKMVSIIQNATSQLITIINNAVFQIVGVLSNLTSAGISAFQTLAFGMVSALQSASLNISSILSAMASSAKSVFSNMVSAASSAASNVVSALSGALSKARSIVNKIKNMINAAWNAVTNAAKNLYDELVGHSIFPDLAKGIERETARIVSSITKMIPAMETVNTTIVSTTPPSASTNIINITVNAEGVSDINSLARMIAKEVRRVI